MWISVLVFLTILLAAFLQSASGFGFAIIVMSIWPIFLPVAEATQLMHFGGIVVIATVTVKYRHHINYRITLLPLLFALAGSNLGVLTLVRLQNETAVFVFGFILIAVALYLIVFSRRIRIRPTWYSAVIAGIVSGVMGGFANMGGPPMVLYYTVATRSKEEYIATLQFYFVVLTVVKMGLLWSLRGLSPFILSHIPVVVVASGIGLAVGMRLFRSISTPVLRYVIYGIMIAAGIWFIIR